MRFLKDPAVAADLAISCFYLSILLGFFHPLFWVLSLSLLILCYPSIRTLLDKSFDISRWWYFFVPLIIVLGTYLRYSPIPIGDVLRDVIAYHYSFDYSKLYPDSPLLPPHNLWMAFDVAAMWVASFFGDEATARILGGVGFILLVSVTAVCIFFRLDSHKDKWFWLCALLFLVLLSSFTGRATSGRPELFATAWLLSASFLRPILWVLFGLILSPSYWLFALYSVGALLLNTSWSKRICAGAITGAMSCIYWIVSTDGLWLDSLALIGKWKDVLPFPMYELRSIVPHLLSIPVVVLIGIISSGLVMRRKELLPSLAPFILVISAILLPNYMRYITPVVCLLAIAAAIVIQKSSFRVPGVIKFFLFFLLPIWVTGNNSGSWEANNIPRFSLPVGSYLLAENDQAQFGTVLLNPHIQTAPALDPSANDFDIIQLLISMQSVGELDCDLVRKYGFSHVQERSLMVIPSCLELAAVDHSWRLWKVVRTSPDSGD